MKKNVFVAIAVLTLGMIGSAFAGDVYVITSSDGSVSAGDIKDVYSGDKPTVKAVDNTAAQSDFVTKVMGTTVSSYNSAWAKRSFREGLSAPKVLNSDAEVIAFVKSNSGSVGYTTKDPGPDAKVLKKF
jgi:hypothetical protein